MRGTRVSELSTTVLMPYGVSTAVMGKSMQAIGFIVMWKIKAKQRFRNLPAISQLQMVIIAISFLVLPMGNIPIKAAQNLLLPLPQKKMEILTVTLVYFSERT